LLTDTETIKEEEEEHEKKEEEIPNEDDEADVAYPDTEIVVEHLTGKV